MDAGVLAQYVFNGVMLGVIYAMVAVGFTLFFGVLDVIQFAHGDVVMAGAFVGLATYVALHVLGVAAPAVVVFAVACAAGLGMALVGAVIARWLILPLRAAPAFNTLLVTLMLGSILRELVRLFYPNGSNPQPFPRLLPSASVNLGHFTLRLDTTILIIAGLVMIVAVNLVVRRTRLGLAIRAVAQDSETARVMGIDFERVVLVTFAIGSALAGFAGVVYGLYYNEVNFDIGLLLGVIGFSAAVVGGLGSIYGAILGGFLFAALQTVGSVALPVSSAYNNVFAFAVVIVLMTWKPTGLIAERASERV
ncbi:MAG: branched-chain amino acid ABC transporter permease [Proteobacteria bacterium]|jgi:branched-chain amino acid transport system permease protein|nr:branched-chain amino acid ABC transporter permease [Pseudomonadota bacterium]